MYQLTGQSFCKFDFGSSENLKRYGTAEPPRYNLNLVQAPVNIIYGENDPLAPPKVFFFFLLFFSSKFKYWH